MAVNHLEQLVAEWYEYNGYFVKKNVLVGKRQKGGYECELDIVAFNPKTKKLVQIEPSLDAHSWEKREARFEKKFKAGKKYIPDLFKGVDLPTEIEQIALLVFASKINKKEIAGGRIMLVDELLKQIVASLSGKRIEKEAVPEQYSLLRMIQFITHFKGKIWGETK
ncbi:MAG: hypothetical protein ABSA64_04595 [Sedimentisphaerales bacterium]